MLEQQRTSMAFTLNALMKSMRTEVRRYLPCSYLIAQPAVATCEQRHASSLISLHVGFYWKNDGCCVGFSVVDSS